MIISGSIDVVDKGISSLCFMAKSHSIYMCVCGYRYIVVIVQFPSYVRLFATPWTVTYQASLSWQMDKEDVVYIPQDKQ